MTMENDLEAFIATSLDCAELNALKYNSQNGTIVLEFVLQGELEPFTYQRLEAKIKTSLDLLHGNGEKQSVQVKASSTVMAGLTFLRLSTRADSLGPEDLELLVGILQAEFRDRIYCDEGGLHHSPAWPGQVKRNIQEQLDQARNRGGRIFASRERGRIRLFSQ
mgnify:CR=1 FL=1